MTAPHTTDDAGRRARRTTVIDLHDATLAREALYERLLSTSPNGELIIDLRDGVLDAILELAPTGRTIPPSPTPSGRPPDLQDGLSVVAIEDGPEWEKAEEFVYDTLRQARLHRREPRPPGGRAGQVPEPLALPRGRQRRGDIVGTTRAIFGEFHELPVGQFQRIDFADEEPDVRALVDRGRPDGPQQGRHRAPVPRGLGRRACAPAPAPSPASASAG